MGEGPDRLKNDLIHQQEEENERQRLDKQKYKDDKRKLNEAIQSRIENKKNINNNSNNKNISNVAPSMASSSEDELPEALRQTREQPNNNNNNNNNNNMSDGILSDDGSSLNDVGVLENPAETEVEEYKKYVELRMKFADQFDGK